MLRSSQICQRFACQESQIWQRRELKLLPLTKWQFLDSEHLVRLVPWLNIGAMSFEGPKMEVQKRRLSGGGCKNQLLNMRGLAGRGWSKIMMGGNYRASEKISKKFSRTRPIFVIWFTHSEPLKLVLAAAYVVKFDFRSWMKIPPLPTLQFFIPIWSWKKVEKTFKSR